MMVGDWKALAARVIAYRDSKQFAPTMWGDLPTRLSCIHSEVRELEDALSALGEAAAHRSAAYLEQVARHEVADIAMYSLSILHDMGRDSWSFRTSYHGGAARFCSASEMTRPLRRHTDDAFRAWRKGDRKDAMVCIELVLVALMDLRVRVLGWRGDVAIDVLEKIAASADRPPAHGKDPRS